MKKIINLFMVGLLLVSFGANAQKTSLPTDIAGRTKMPFANQSNGSSTKAVVMSEGFEGGALPAGWTQEFTTGALSWTYYNGSSSGNPAAAHTGSYNALFYSSTYSSTKLVTPSMDISALAAPKLKFWHTQAFWSPDQDTLKVYYKTSLAGTWTLLQTYSSNIATWTEEIISLPSPSATYYVAFHGAADYGYGICVDDIMVYEPDPNDVGVSSVDFGGGLPSTVSPKVTVKNFGTAVQTFDVTLNIGAYTNTQTVTGLAAGATQQVTFSNWTSTAGTYTVEAYTLLGTDTYRANDTLRKSINIVNITKKAFGYMAYTTDPNFTNGPIIFDLADPSQIVQIVSDAGNFVAGGTMAGTTWYGCVYSENNLITIDTTTGARTTVGALGFALNSLAWDPTTTTLFGTSSTDLFSVNTTTGVATQIGTGGVASSVFINLGCNPINGTLYSVDINTDILYSFNKTTGIPTSVGPTGQALAYAQDMEFTSSGTLVLTAYSTYGFLGSADVATGTTTELSKFGDNVGGGTSQYEICAFAIPAATDFSVGVNEYSSNVAISNFPNPANGWMVIDAAADMNQIRIFNINGQLVNDVKVNSNHYVLNTTSMANGTYLLQVITSKGISTRKFEIQH